MIRPKHFDHNHFFSFLCITHFIAGTYSVFFVSSMVLVSKFPQQYLIPYLYGEGYSGVIVSVINVGTIAIGNNNEESVLIYFTVGIVLLLCTMFLLGCSQYSRTYNYYTRNNFENTKRNMTSFSEIVMIGKKIWPSMVAFNITIGTIFALHPSITSLVVSESYGHGDVWNGKIVSLNFNFYSINILNIFLV